MIGFLRSLLTLVFALFAFTVLAVVVSASVRAGWSAPPGDFDAVVALPDGSGDRDAATAHGFEIALALLRTGRAGAIVTPGGEEGEALRREALGLGLPEDRVIAEDGARGVFATARDVAGIAKERRWRRIALVADAYRSLRAERLFAYATGLDVESAPVSGPADAPILDRVLTALREAGAWWVALARVALDAAGLDGNG